MIEPGTTATPADVSSHYDTLDPFYRELWGEHLHHGLFERGEKHPERAAIALAHRVAHAAAVSAGSVICDVGSGYGAAAKLFAEEYGAMVTGYTLSAVQRDHAVARAAGDVRIRHVLGDWLEAPIESASLDAVIAIESTAHMADKPAFFRKAAETLKPGGRLVVCAWLASGNERRWERRWLLEPICEEGRLPSLGTAAEYTRWIRAAGLEPVSFEDLSDRVRRTWVVCIRRMAVRLLSSRAAWRFLLDANNRDRVFALTVPRILIAYATGCMRYGFFIARRSEST